MDMNILNQNTNNFKFNLNSFLTSNLGSNFGNKNDNSPYYAKKGEPMYQKNMDSDDDGVISFDEFREYCKSNGISTSDMKKMLEMRMTYKMMQENSNTASKDKKAEKEDFKIGDLDIIYAKDGDDKFDESMDSNGDSKISYREYLRYCEKNAKPEDIHNNTKIIEDSKTKFMTVSYGKVSNAYHKTEYETPKVKVESKA